MFLHVTFCISSAFFYLFIVNLNYLLWLMGTVTGLHFWNVVLHRTMTNKGFLDLILILIPKCHVLGPIFLCMCRYSFFLPLSANYCWSQHEPKQFTYPEWNYCFHPKMTYKLWNSINTECRRGTDTKNENKTKKKKKTWLKGCSCALLFLAH